MRRYLPTFRGWIALVLPLVGGSIFVTLLPVRYVESGVGTWIAHPVEPSAWVFGGVTLVICALGCLETFRRGSRADKAAFCVAMLLTLCLLWEFCAVTLMQVKVH
jgi:hypothetical protein